MFPRRHLLALSKSNSLFFNLRRYYSLKHAGNRPIIDLLQKCKVQEENQATPNSFKIIAYVKALQAVSQLEQPIRSRADLAEVKSIGAGIATKINDYLYAEAEDTLDPESPDFLELKKGRALALFEGIPGVGSTTAKRLVEAGCLDLQELASERFCKMITAAQRVRLKYLNILKSPLEMSQADQVLHSCQQVLDPKYELHLVGDCRRGNSPLSAVELLAVHPDFVHVPLPVEPPPCTIPLEDALTKLPSKKTRAVKAKETHLETKLLPVLREQGLIADTLQSQIGKMWRGIMRLPEEAFDSSQRFQRLMAIKNQEGVFVETTIHLAPYRSRGVALLFLTGDVDFIKHLSIKAKQMEMLLNEYGLWQWNHEQPEDPEQGYWSLIKCPTEEDVFQALDMEYVDPRRRNFRFLSPKRTRSKRS